MKKTHEWFKNLSRVGKVSALSTIVLGGLFVATATTPPPDGTDQVRTTNTSTHEPVVETKTETEVISVVFEKLTREDSSLAKGESYIETMGVDGEKVITHTVTYTDGEETHRETAEEITREPIDQVTVIGTYVAPEPARSCDPNYSGCVPIASDVDCGGGSGNGPAYAYGTSQVIGYDIYGLDRDGNGWACE